MADWVYALIDRVGRFIAIVLGYQVTTTANVIEVLWTTVAIVGLTFGAMGVMWARNDKDALRGTPLESILHLIADENLRVEWSRVWALVFCLITGVNALVVPSRPDTEYALNAVIGGVCILAIEGIVFVSAVEALTFKRLFWRKLQEIEAKEREAVIRGGRRSGDAGRQLHVAYPDEDVITEG